MKKVSFIILMDNLILSLLFCFLPFVLEAQSVSQKLQNAYVQFEKDPQLSHAISSLYIIDAKNGHVVFDKNSQIGLAPASTQKVITSVTAFELLGKDYKYKTTLNIEGKLIKEILHGNIIIHGSGDPTLGSWRWDATSEEKVIERFIFAIKKKGIKKINGSIILNTDRWEKQIEPDGWIWQDMGNYYGAGSSGFNWRENQFDIFLKSGNKIGDPVEITGTKPDVLYHSKLESELSSAAVGTGDNAYVYMIPEVIRGTIPVNEKRFTISASMFKAKDEFISTLNNRLAINGIIIENQPIKTADSKPNIIHTEFSPTLDSMIYWFNKKSINLYGEALMKTMAFEKTGFGSYSKAVELVQNFWQERGIDKSALNIYDGSGLSPMNRVTTHAQVAVLNFAKKQVWFPLLINSFPENNGMKMKSGTIRNVKGYTGYHIAKDGSEYIFSFLVNNYNGSSFAIVQKMFKVLDILK